MRCVIAHSAKLLPEQHQDDADDRRRPTLRRRCPVATPYAGEGASRIGAPQLLQNDAARRVRRMAFRHQTGGSLAGAGDRNRSGSRRTGRPPGGAGASATAAAASKCPCGIPGRSTPRSLDRPPAGDRMIIGVNSGFVGRSDTWQTCWRKSKRCSTEGEAELAGVASADALEQFRIKYLGTKGRVKGLMTLLGQVPREEKPAVGQRVNAVKDQLTAAFEARRQSISRRRRRDAADYVDVTEPGRQPELGTATS